MTVASSTSSAGPFEGNGVTVSFDFAFKVFSATEILVYLTDPYAVDAVQSLSTHYSVTLSAEQDEVPGGSVTFLSAPGVGYKVTILRNVEAVQGASLPNQGGFYPEVIETALDRLTMLVQQLGERVGRSLLVGVTVEDPNVMLDQVSTAVTAADAYAASAGASASAAETSKTQAGNSATWAELSANAAQFNATVASEAALALSNADLPEVDVTATGTSVLEHMELCAASSAISRSIPEGPLGSRIGFKDAGQNFFAHPLTVVPPSGHRIESLAVDEALVLDRQHVFLTFKQTASGVWRIF